MKMLTLHSQDVMPMVGLGTWQSSEAEIHTAIDSALDTGYRHIDCASIYGNENIIGDAMHSSMQNYQISREQLWVTSKLWNSFHAPEDVEPALKQTLQDLQLEYLDLYLMHWPVAFVKSLGLSVPSQADEFVTPPIPIIETWQAMEACMKKGLVKNIGVSNFSISKLKEITEHSDTLPAINQVECHVNLAQFDLVNFCQENNIHVTAYSPLGAPGLPERLQRDHQVIPPLQHETILTIANNRGATPAQVCLAWLLARNIIVIPKSVKPHRIEENWCSQKVQLDDNDIANINALNADFRYIHPVFWQLPGGWFNADELWG